MVGARRHRDVNIDSRGVYLLNLARTALTLTNMTQEANVVDTQAEVEPSSQFLETHQLLRFPVTGRSSCVSTHDICLPR